MSPAAVLQFWFGPLDEHGMAQPAQRQRWFQRDDDFDEQIRSQFEPWLAAAAQGQLDLWLQDPKGWLAFLILCDQFPRNLYRGSAQAFAWDERSRTAARAGINQRRHLQLGIDEQAFAFLPFEHSEDLADQYLACGLCLSLRDHSPKSLREATGTYLRHAQQHRDTILRFGRFPYRNHALGRSSTAEELAFLESAAHP